MEILERLESEISHCSWLLSQNNLRSDGWTLKQPEVLSLMEKLRAAGKPLSMFGGQFYRGIVTGLNKAFVIDETTRQQLINEDKRSAEIIKPWVRGQDIQRWRVNWAGVYLLFTRRGINIDSYPAVRDYLLQFKDQLHPGVAGGRKPGHYQWYEIQDTIDYYPELEKPKIVYADIARTYKFSYDAEDYYLGNTCYFIPINDLYLLGVLSSKTVEFFCHQLTATEPGGFVRLHTIYVRQFPIPDAPPDERQAIEKLVRRLLDLRGEGAEVAGLEGELNERVYRLFGLTPEEIRLVEGRE